MSIEHKEVIAAIVGAHRGRVFAMEQRKRIDLSLGAYLRMTLGWSRALPKAERDAISTTAQEMIAAGEQYLRELKRYEARQEKRKSLARQKARKKPTKPQPPEQPPPEPELETLDIILATIQSRGPFDEIEKNSTREMERLAELLPIYPWVLEPDQRGLGALGLAIIVAEAAGPEARELTDYPTPAHLWTRMGLGIFDGVRQGGLLKTASKEAWIKHKYPPIRRSRIWTLGRALVNGNHTGEGEDKRDLKWRQIYVARKAYEREKAEAAGLRVVPASAIPTKRAAEFMSLGHVDRRAQRYMEKALLKRIWIRWRQAGRANQAVEPRLSLPPAAAA